MEHYTSSQLAQHRSELHAQICVADVALNSVCWVAAYTGRHDALYTATLSLRCTGQQWQVGSRLACISVLLLDCRSGRRLGQTAAVVVTVGGGTAAALLRRMVRAPKGTNCDSIRTSSLDFDAYFWHFVLQCMWYGRFLGPGAQEHSSPGWLSVRYCMQRSLGAALCVVQLACGVWLTVPLPLWRVGLRRGQHMGLPERLGSLWRPGVYGCGCRCSSVPCDPGTQYWHDHVDVVVLWFRAKQKAAYHLLRPSRRKQSNRPTRSETAICYVLFSTCSTYCKSRCQHLCQVQRAQLPRCNDD